MLQGFMVGRLGKDAELSYTKGGDPVCNFSIACKAGYGDREKTLWVDCAVWGERGKKLSEYLLKGKEIVVQGDLDVRAWTSDRDQETHANLQLTVRELSLIGGKKAVAA